MRPLFHAHGQLGSSGTRVAGRVTAVQQGSLPANPCAALCVQVVLVSPQIPQNAGEAEGGI